MEELQYITLSPQETAKLLSVGNGDAALLLLYLRASGDTALRHAKERLPLTDDALGWAETLLKQLGLLEVSAAATRFDRERAPNYTSESLVAYAAKDETFAPLQGEISRRLGRPLSHEEMKTLLSIRDYLGLPPEVVSMAFTYCLQRTEAYNKAHGTDRTVSMRSFEKECYVWANQGIVTLEQASDYIARSLAMQAPEAQVKKALQLDHPLVDSERRYIKSWLELGFPPESIRLAYEKTVLGTGRLAWAYLDKVLQNWHEKGLHTLAEIQAGDQKQSAPAQSGGFELGESERRAIEELHRSRKAIKGEE